MASVFQMEPDGSFEVRNEVSDSYWKNGYIIIRSLLSEAEVDLIEEGWTSDPYLQEKIYEQSDDKGDLMRLAVWDDASMDPSGLFGRSQKLAGTVEKLLGDEVYHYHAKYLEKPKHTGGSFVWHQDYGLVSVEELNRCQVTEECRKWKENKEVVCAEVYWYHYGNLFPNDMCTAFLAVDDIDEENGCLQIIPASHNCGRLEHILYKEQIQADMERVQHYINQMGVLAVDMKRGDVLIFHSNILHTSSKNDSDRRRLALAVAYNTKRNNPTKKHHHPQYTKMDMVSNDALLEWEKTKEWDSCKKFYDPHGSQNHMQTIQSSTNG